MNNQLPIEQEIPASQTDISSISVYRRPEIIFTDGYLNDPIKFNVNQTFIDDSLVREVEYLTDLERDVTGFYIAKIRGEETVRNILPIIMRSPTYSRQAFYEIINYEFTELT